jgi:hypothetical protein
MPKFDLNLKFYSSYYISLLISSFLLQLDFIGGVVVYITSWINTVLMYTFLKDWFSGDKSWFIVALGFTAFVFLIRHLVVLPLEFYTKKDVKFVSWAKFVLPFMVFGFQVYLTNKIFAQPMPESMLKNIFGEFYARNIINFFGGLDNLNIQQSFAEKQLWAPRYMFWYIGPLLILYYKGVLYKPKSAKAPEAHPPAAAPAEHH